MEGVIGGDGDDDLSAGAATVPVRLEGGPGGDRLEANSVATTLVGDSGNDQLIGGNAGDSLDGGGGNDSLLPDDGADTVLAGAGVDSISSQDGVVDTIDCGGNRDSLLVDLNDSLANCDDPAPPADPTPPAGPPSGTTPPARLLPTLAFGAKAGAKSTVLRRLSVGAVEPGASVTAKCRTNRGPALQADEGLQESGRAVEAAADELRGQGAPGRRQADLPGHEAGHDRLGQGADDSEAQEAVDGDTVPAAGDDEAGRLLLKYPPRRGPFPGSRISR